MEDKKAKTEVFVDDVDDFEDCEVFEGSYTSDLEDGDPCGSFCDMPEDEIEQYHKLNQDKK